MKSGIYFGEVYDARQENLPASDGVRVLPFNTGILIKSETDPVRELPAFPSKRTWQDMEGRTVYDFGQNAGGYVAFSVQGEAGTKVTVEHSEILDKDGVFDRSSMRSAEARAEYILKR